MKIHAALVTTCLLTTMPALASPSAPAAPPAAATVYRLEFQLTTAEPGKAPTTTQFALNVVEHRAAELEIGDNVPLSGSGGPNGAAIRQHVGTRVVANVEARGPDLLLDVDTELSALVGPGIVHKLQTKDVALAPIGKKTVVASIDHDRAHTELVVTPNRL
jgi:hypothetical protein